MDKLVNSLTKPKYAQKLVVLSTGYNKDIDQLITTNFALTSRFLETIDFAFIKLKHYPWLLTKVLTDFYKKKNAATKFISAYTAIYSTKIVCFAVL